MPSESPKKIVDELRQELNDSLAAHFLATEGLDRMRTWTQDLRLPHVADPLILMGYDTPVGPNPPRYAQWHKTQTVYALQRNGQIENRLGRQWLVTFYSEWDEHYRERLEAAHGCQKGDIKVDVFGDLRHMRNDVVHGRGSASLNRTGKCKVLTWFKVPHYIEPTMRQLGTLPDLIPWDDLISGPWPRQ